MMKHEEMITLIGNMFIDAYVAGDRKDLDSYRSARADRDHLFDEIRELYAELEHESYEREQIQVELNKANHRIEGLQRDYDHMREIKDRLLMLLKRKSDELKEAKLNMAEFYGKKISHVDDRSLYPASTPEDLSEAFAKYATIPDDADKFSEHVAGPGPATNEASADAEGEEVPDHHDAFDAMFPGCTPDDLPFPDVAVAGLGPATTEASAYAEGEAAPASEVEGSDE